MALSPQKRLSKEVDISRVFNHGRKFSSSFFRLFFYPTKNRYSRYAVVVSKKVSKKAIERNRIRRRIQAWICQNEDRMIKAGPRDYLMFINPRAAVLSRKQLYEELTNFFH